MNHTFFKKIRATQFCQNIPFRFW